MRSQIPFQSSRLISNCFILCSIMAAACTPAVNTSLERARADYQQAASDPAIKADASADLFAAEKLLQKAEKAWHEDDDTDETNHLAYLASQKIELARATASEAAAKKDFEDFSSKKDEIRLKAREAEIEKLKAKRVPQGILVTLGDVLFDTGRATLKPGSLQKMYPIVEYLQAHTGSRVKIEGHTDSQGSTDYNIQLSQNRAESVRNFLISNGISPERIVAQGMGEDYPVATNSTAAGRQQNRRVEVTITDDPAAKAPVSSGTGPGPGL
jgi:OOP family OmpA-OmpF porin